MSNFMDYLDWRGDLSFMQAPFCEVDNLILSYLSYVKLSGIAPAYGEASITLEEMSEQFFQKNTKEDLDRDRSFVRMAPYLMQKMAKSRRFREARIQNLENQIDEVLELQFCALEILLEDGTSFISYQGTDDSIVGWKEDFQLSNGVVPAEKEAVDYLNRIGGIQSRPIRIGGHSKGGNLAIYAAAGCDAQVKDKIIEIYNNDGPGFTSEFLESEGLQAIKPKIRRYIPESSIIGMLLEHTVEPIMIKSSQKGPLQHDGFSWEVLGSTFPRCQELSKTGKIFDETLRSWIYQLNPTDREAFIEDFFSVLEAPGAKTLTELQEGGLKSAKAMFARSQELNPETRKIVEQLLKTMASHWVEFLPFGQGQGNLRKSTQ